MNWKITRLNSVIYDVKNTNDSLCGRISFNSKNGMWKVELMMVAGFDKAWGTTHEAIAYIRGVEAAVKVYGREMAS